MGYVNLAVLTVLYVAEITIKGYHVQVLVTKKERPSKAEVEVLPEVVRALREFIKI